eukprot:1566521-Lingulodinium_polyedra.AAC.1
MLVNAIQRHSKRLVRRGLIKSEGVGGLVEAPVVPREAPTSFADIRRGVVLRGGASGAVSYPR